MIGEDEVVVYRLGDIDDGQGKAVRFGCLPDGVTGCSGVVAADDEPASDVVLAEGVQDRLHILVSQLAPSGAEDGAGGVGDALPFVGGCAAKIYEITG